MSQTSPPQANVGVWRDGYRLAMLKDATLPHACVKCGLPVTTRGIRKTYYWAPSSFLRFIPFPGSLIALIIALVIRKKIKVEIPVCPAHRKRRAIALTLTWLFGGIGMGAIGMGLNWALSSNIADADNAPQVIVVGIAMLLIGIICFVFAGRLLIPKQIDENQAVFSGAGAQFLRLLPTSPNVKP